MDCYEKYKNLNMELVSSCNRNELGTDIELRDIMFKKFNPNLINKDRKNLIDDLLIFTYSYTDIDSIYQSVKLEPSRILINDSENLCRALNDMNVKAEIDLFFKDLINIVEWWKVKASENGIHVNLNLDIQDKKIFIVSTSFLFKYKNMEYGKFLEFYDSIERGHADVKELIILLDIAFNKAMKLE